VAQLKNDQHGGLPRVVSDNKKPLIQTKHQGAFYGDPSLPAEYVNRFSSLAPQAERELSLLEL
jgi:hypothetical protein